ADPLRTLRERLQAARAGPDRPAARCATSSGEMLRCRVKCRPAKQASIDTLGRLWQARDREEPRWSARARYQEETMEQQARRAIGAWGAGVPRLAPLLPLQLVDRPHRSPEQRLMAAVLEDAMRELARPSEIWVGPAGRRRAGGQGGGGAARGGGA